MNSNTNPRGIELADRLESLLNLPLASAAEVEPWDRAAAEVQVWNEEHARELPIDLTRMAHWLEHFFTDSDIRARDASYREDQERKVWVLVRQLRGTDGPLERLRRKIIPALEPHLARLREAAEKTPGCSLITCGEIDDSYLIFVMGISCEFLSGTTPDFHLSFSCVGMSRPGDSEMGFTCSVAWYRDFVLNKSTMATIHEARWRKRFHEDADIAALTATFPRMAEVFLRALRRGHPPSAMAAFRSAVWERCRRMFG